MNETLSTTEKMYVTMPMSAMSPAHRAASAYSNEEEVYTSFERAITARLLAKQGYRPYSSDAPLPSSRSYPQTGPISRNPFPELAVRSLAVRNLNMQEVQMNSIARDPSRKARYTRQHVMLFCFAIMCILAGFDLMGLIVLHLR